MKLILATTLLLASGGAPAASADNAEERVQLPGAVEEQFGDERQLLLSTTVVLVQASVLPEPGPDPPSSIDATLRALTDAHRAYVDADPNRFAALSNLTSAAVFGRHDLLAPLAERTRRTRATGYRHFARLRAAGLTTAPPERLQALSQLLIDGSTGIELCHLIDADEPLRAAAYAELCGVVAAGLRGRSEA